MGKASQSGSSNRTESLCHGAGPSGISDLTDSFGREVTWADLDRANSAERFASYLDGLAGVMGMRPASDRCVSTARAYCFRASKGSDLVRKTPRRKEAGDDRQHEKADDDFL